MAKRRAMRVEKMMGAEGSPVGALRSPSKYRIGYRKFLLIRDPALLVRLALLEQLLVTLLIEVGHRDPSVRHLVGGTAAAVDPHVRIHDVRIVVGVVVPLLHDQNRAG